jgi:chromosome segregation ATPase
MTKLGKCLVVLIVAASFAVLGFAWVSANGGPNWDAEAAALHEYSIQKSEGKWSVSDRETGTAVSVQPPSVEAAAVLAARKDLKSKMDKEDAELKKDTEYYRTQVVKVRNDNEADVKALDARVKELIGQVAALDEKILGLSNEVVKHSQEAQSVRTEVAKRREDVYRLARELEEVRADKFRADQLISRLRDQLYRLNGVATALEGRNRQLRNQGSAGTPKTTSTQGAGGAAAGATALRGPSSG